MAEQEDDTKEQPPATTKEVPEASLQGSGGGTPTAAGAALMGTRRQGAQRGGRQTEQSLPKGTRSRRGTERSSKRKKSQGAERTVVDAAAVRVLGEVVRRPELGADHLGRHICVTSAEAVQTERAMSFGWLVRVMG